MEALKGVRAADPFTRRQTRPSIVTKDIKTTDMSSEQSLIVQEQQRKAKMDKENRKKVASLVLLYYWVVSVMRIYESFYVFQYIFFVWLIISPLFGNRMARRMSCEVCGTIYTTGLCYFH